MASGKEVKTTLPEEEYQALKQYCDSRGISISEALRTAIRILLFGAEKPEADVVKYIEKDIPILYPNVKCSRCGRVFQLNERAHYIRIEFSDGTTKKAYYCMDCWAEMTADPKKALEKKRLEIQLRELKKMVDSYAKSGLLVEDVKKVIKKLEELESKAQMIYNNIEREAIKNLDRIDVEAVNKLLNELDRVKREIQDVKSMLFGVLKIGKALRKVVSKAESYESMR